MPCLCSTFGVFYKMAFNVQRMAHHTGQEQLKIGLLEQL